MILVKPGMRYRDFGKVIQGHAHANGFSVVRAFCGHGINQLFHCAPDVLHYASKCCSLRASQWNYSSSFGADNKGVGVLKPGHIFTIEPMICEGDYNEVLW